MPITWPATGYVSAGCLGERGKYPPTGWPITGVTIARKKRMRTIMVRSGVADQPPLPGLGTLGALGAAGARGAWLAPLRAG